MCNSRNALAKNADHQRQMTDLVASDSLALGLIYKRRPIFVLSRADGNASATSENAPAELKGLYGRIGNEADALSGSARYAYIRLLIRLVPKFIRRSRRHKTPLSNPQQTSSEHTAIVCGTESMRPQAVLSRYGAFP